MAIVGGCSSFLRLRLVLFGQGLGSRRWIRGDFGGVRVHADEHFSLGLNEVSNALRVSLGLGCLIGLGSTFTVAQFVQNVQFIFFAKEKRDDRDKCSVKVVTWAYVSWSTSLGSLTL